MPHTPGPWKTYFYKGHTPTEITIRQEGSGARIASMSAGWPKADTADNAKLLAAAPDMLEALEGLDALPRHDIGCEHSKAVRAAIEAATGEGGIAGDRCDECGETPALVGCPDGAQICQTCFDAGLH